MNTLNEEQQRASNPFDSVWVSASAGTGKTKVLTDRVLRLLLQTTTPEKLLCLTFTKAAAAEMENRINSILKKWAICPQGELSQDITSLTQETPEETTTQKARSLFAKTLETPGGMKIMTIHSFCQSLLKRFPLEADVPPHFEVIDDLASISLKQQILNEVLATTTLRDVLQQLTTFLSADAMMDLFERILNDTSRFVHLIEQFPSSSNSLIFKLKQKFNIHKYLTEKQIINDFCSEEEWPLLKSYYLTKEETIRKKLEKDPKSLQAWETNEKLKAFETIKATEILLKIAWLVIEKYQNIKRHKALLDYTDLIEKTNNLLSKSDMSAWVLYKLDGGIDHILVDEAQDTNRPQWNIIKALAEEFFSGEDASDRIRTLFVVGDKKQSIFSFQGADPVAFEEMRTHFEQRILNSQNSFYNIPLNYSFRSTEPVLRLVNYLLQNEQAKNGVLSDNEKAYHLANRSDDAGLVEIWPVEEVQPTDTPDPWKPPVERQENESAMKRLINKMADKIKNMIGHDILLSQNRPVQPGDILILLQKRGHVMDQIVRSLRERHIPVAGVDRLILSEHLAIQDLMALTEFVLQPQNDLNLANLVKSPILGLSEDDLYHICINRKETSVWTRLQKLYPKQADILKQIINIADKTPPFEFFSTILGAFGMRKKFIARFGTEVNEALDEFLSLALNFEQINTPSLQGFLSWFSHHEIEIKRDLDNSGIDAVRIMTVHGSKGLQGNIVFLPDTCSSRSKAPSGGDFIWLEDGSPLWIPNTHLRPASLQDYFNNITHLNNQEKRRLLYVALTRARDRLYIAGYGKKSSNNWYDLIINSLPKEIQPDKDGIIRWKSTQKHKKQQKTKQNLPYDYETLPSWVNIIPPKEEPIAPPLSPSKLEESDDEWTVEESILQPNQELALRRGTFIHKLLQYLPDIPSNQRLEFAQKMCPSDIELPDNLLQIFERVDLQDLFGSNSIAEVPVVGTINGKAVSGQIDRLVVLEKEVKIIDFKTNRFVPQKIPDMYKKQLNAYKDLLKEIFPDKIIKAYILWTQTLYFEEVK